MDARTQELLDRLVAPGQFPNMSCSEGHELHEGVTDASQQMKNALTTYAVTMSYDYPAEAPVECGLWCDICKEHIDKPKDHKPTCLLA